MLRNQLRPAVVITLALMLITGLLYPALVTLIAQTLFPRQANGSVVSLAGKPVGSELIGQGFSRPEYFHPRPSAAGAGYDGLASGGSNKGPTDRKLADTLIAGSVAQVRAEDGVAGAVPADAATRSASGLDPHISPANALIQVARVARARGVAPARIRALLEAHVEGRTAGLLGEPRVNVLMLNLDLDRTLGAPRRTGGPR
jgi:K+-transporting ATPase ATPase C chain